ncbi:MAG: hypothetical protein AAGC68_00020 [Verrucomicrobiota bacterium]
MELSPPCFPRSLGFVFWAVVLILAPGKSDALSPEIVISEVVTEVSDDSEGALSRFSFSVPSSELGTFQHQFNGEDQVSLVLTWAAPEGKRFEVNPPLGYVGGVLRAIYRAGPDQVGDDLLGIAPLAELVNLAGTEPVYLGLATLSGPTDTGLGVIGGFTLEPGRAFWFDAIKLTVSVPAFYVKSYDISEIQIAIIGEALLNGNPNETWIRLIDQPDAGSPTKTANARSLALLERKLARLEKKIRKAKKKSRLSRVARLNRKRTKLLQRMRLLRI